MKFLRFALPLAIFAAIGILLFSGLGKDTRLVPSPLIGKQTPAFDLPDLHDASRRVTAEELRGQVYLLNVWGSWCVACRIEHPVLTEFAKTGVVPVIGLDWKDDPAEGKRWLQQFGDPFDRIAVDQIGRTAIDFGVYGAPETFLVDAAGIIRYKHVGPLTRDVIEKELAPLIESLKVASSKKDAP